jgi:hypothetical protein
VISPLLGQVVLLIWVLGLIAGIGAFAYAITYLDLTSEPTEPLTATLAFTTFPILGLLVAIAAWTWILFARKGRCSDGKRRN